MAFLERSRSFIFWFIDFFRKNSVTKHYNEIKFINENPTHKKAIEKKQALLSTLISHAKETTGFYSKINSSRLENFPVIDKQVVIDNFDSFISSKSKNKKIFKSTTSGSTGVPFETYKDKNKLKRNTADTIYFSELANYKLGSPLIYVRLWSKKFMKSKFEFFSQNIIPHDILKNSEEEIIDFLKMLKNLKSKKTLMIYPSFLEEICRYIETNNYSVEDTNISSIITTSEKLNDYEKERSQEYFKCPIYERYSNTENGIIAQNTSEHKEYYQINHASYNVEILDVETNKHVKDGEVGKIVITDLYNFTMPFIRYDTGDLATYKKIEGEHPVLSKIYGRLMDSIYNTKGDFVSPHIFFRILHFSKLKQYQFIQNTKTSYTFKLNAKKEDTKEQEMMDYFKTFLGQDASFNFEYVDDIMQLESGKRKKVVNLMSN